MKIIAGKLKNKTILTTMSRDYRPTTGRVKEAVFNILSHGEFRDALKDAVTIDLFAGTGALSFEALSRGAKTAILVEKNLANFNLLRQNAQNLAVADNVMLMKQDATSLPTAKLKCNIAFIDPPFNQKLVDPTLKSLLKGEWLANGALIVIETHENDPYNPAACFIEVASRVYGHAIVKIYRYENTSV